MSTVLGADWRLWVTLVHPALVPGYVPLVVGVFGWVYLAATVAAAAFFAAWAVTSAT